MFLYCLFSIIFFNSTIAQEKPISLANNEALKFLIDSVEGRQVSSSVEFNYPEASLEFLKNKINLFLGEQKKELFRTSKKNTKKYYKFRDLKEINNYNAQDILNFSAQWGDLQQYNLNDDDVTNISLIKILTMYECTKLSSFKEIMKLDVNQLQAWYLSYVSFMIVLTSARSGRAWGGAGGAFNEGENYIQQVDRTISKKYKSWLKLFCYFSVVFIEKSNNDTTVVKNYIDDIQYYLNYNFNSHWVGYMIPSREKLRIIYLLKNNESFKGLYNNILIEYKKALENYELGSFAGRSKRTEGQEAKDLKELKNELFWKFEPQEVRNSFYKKVIALIFGGTLFAGGLMVFLQKKLGWNFRWSKAKQ